MFDNVPLRVKAKDIISVAFVNWLGLLAKIISRKFEPIMRTIIRRSNKPRNYDSWNMKYCIGYKPSPIKSQSFHSL